MGGAIGVRRSHFCKIDMKKIFSLIIIGLFFVFSVVSCTDFADIFDDQGKTSSSKQAKHKRVAKKSPSKKTSPKKTTTSDDDSDYEREVDNSDISDDEVKVSKKSDKKEPEKNQNTQQETSEDQKPSALGLIWPVKGNIISGFGRRGSRDHDGLDIKAPKGTPVYAAKKGTVIFADVRSGYGNLVIIRHDDNYFTVYAHLDKILVKKGKIVKQNELIGKVGQTGRATTPHLHFEIRYKTDPKDPVLYLPQKK